MKIAIINGPNLNLLGKREEAIYGNVDWDTYYKELTAVFKGKAVLNHFQSNSEGELVSAVQKFGEEYDAIIINPGGFTHSSVAIADALKAVKAKCICVHISLVHKREDYRQKDVVVHSCDGYISGLGLDGYRMAVEHLLG